MFWFILSTVSAAALAAEFAFARCVLERVCFSKHSRSTCIRLAGVYPRVFSCWFPLGCGDGSARAALAAETALVKAAVDRAWQVRRSRAASQDQFCVGAPEPCGGPERLLGSERRDAAAPSRSAPAQQLA